MCKVLVLHFSLSSFLILSRRSDFVFWIYLASLDCFCVAVALCEVGLRQALLHYNGFFLVRLLVVTFIQGACSISFTLFFLFVCLRIVMGCDNSKTKTNPEDFYSTKEFEDLVDVAKHPVAIKLKEEWTLFANAYSSNTGNPADDGDASLRRDALQRLSEQPEEVWADTERNPVTHASVDQVGKAFLNYVRVQLLILGWGGNFDYKVVGVVNQGFIKASAELDVSTADFRPPIIRTWSASEVEMVELFSNSNSKGQTNHFTEKVETKSKTEVDRFLDGYRGATNESKAVLDFFGRLQFHTVLLRSIEEYDEITQESPRGFSFQPNQYLSSRIELVESNLGGPGVALDVGCGSGRDMVYLAARGWLVVGVENRLRLLNCAKALAAKNCAAHRVNSLLWDVRKGSGVVRPGSYQLLHVCRFIHRPSLPRFVKGLAKGGYVIYSHFLEGCENTAIGHPKNSSGFFLHGELQSLLVSCGVMLLHVEECLLHDDRPMIHIVGKKLCCGRFAHGTQLSTPLCSKVLSHCSGITYSFLPNGFRVATEYSKDCPFSTVGVWIDAGSRFENLTNSGVAHFLEHMNFKGTERYSKSQLEELFEFRGAHFNAYTSRDRTAYYVKAFNEDIEKMMDVVADLLKNGRYNPRDIEMERPTILAEMREVEELVDEVLMDNVHQAAYDAETSGLPLTILGPVENISKNIDRKMILDYVQTHYTGPRMCLVSSGGISPDQTHKLAEKFFGDLPSVNNRPILEGTYKGGHTILWNDTMATAQTAVAFPICGASHPDTYPLVLIHNYSYQRRNQNIPWDKVPNLIQLRPFYTPYEETALLGYQIVSIRSQERIRDDTQTIMLNYILSSLYDLCSTCRRKAPGGSQNAEDLGRQMIHYGRRIPVEELFEKVDAVTPQSLRAAAEKYFLSVQPTVSCIGASSALPRYDPLMWMSLQLQPQPKLHILPIPIVFQHHSTTVTTNQKEINKNKQIAAALNDSEKEEDKTPKCVAPGGSKGDNRRVWVGARPSDLILAFGTPRRTGTPQRVLGTRPLCFDAFCRVPPRSRSSGAGRAPAPSLQTAGRETGRSAYGGPGNPPGDPIATARRRKGHHGPAQAQRKSKRQALICFCFCLFFVTSSLKNSRPWRRRWQKEKGGGQGRRAAAKAKNFRGPNSHRHVVGRRNLLCIFSSLWSFLPLAYSAGPFHGTHKKTPLAPEPPRARHFFVSWRMAVVLQVPHAGLGFFFSFSRAVIFTVFTLVSRFILNACFSLNYLRFINSDFFYSVLDHGYMSVSYPILGFSTGLLIFIVVIPPMIIIYL
eukprot:gene71-48_t